MLSVSQPICRATAALAGLAIGVAFAAAPAEAGVASWKAEWPRTDFSKSSVDFAEILSGGPPKDGIPAIDAPSFRNVGDVDDIPPSEPVIAVSLNGDTRAYPLRILIWHEIVNDTVGGVPVLVTYCPLCNSSIVFRREVDGRVLDFGTTGKLRNSDLVMYDRQTESWWQQFTGTGIVGAMTGRMLEMLPSRVESLSKFTARGPDGKVLAEPRNYVRPYGANPYRRYDTRPRPYPFFAGPLPVGVAPLAYVVAVGDQAWTLDLLRRVGRVEHGDLVLTWEAGQNSALDAGTIAEGRDIGNVVVQRRTPDGLVDEVHDVTFAFVFNAFRPNGALHAE